MVDNNSKTSLSRYIEKNISLTKINNNRATHSYNNIVIFICDRFFLYNVIQEVFLLQHNSTTGLKVPFDQSQQQYKLQLIIFPKLKQRLSDDHLSKSKRFFSLSLGIGSNDSGPSYHMVMQTTMYLFWILNQILYVPWQVCYPSSHIGIYLLKSEHYLTTVLLKGFTPQTVY